MFKYEEYDVNKRFSFFIKKLWILDNLVNPVPIIGKSVLPNGCFNIAVIEGDGLLINHLDWEKHLTQGTYFCGQMTEAVGVKILPRSKATMIQLHAWVPAHFSSLAIDGFTDSIVSIDLLKIGSELLNNLHGLSNLAIYEHIILIFAPLLKVSPISRLIYRAASIILDTHGKYAISKLATDLNCSPRHLQKIFKKHIGVSPKQLALLVKLRSAVDDIAYPPHKQSLTTLALDNHFYDQAHFNNTFKSVVKTSQIISIV